MKPLSARSGSCALAILLLLFAGGSLFGGWESDYAKGLKEYKRGDYSDALRYFLKAANDKGADCANCIREGMRFYDYVPSYYIGECYYRTDRKDKALPYYRRSLEMGVIQNQPDLVRTLQKHMEELQAAAKPKETGEKPRVQETPDTQIPAPAVQKGPTPSLKEKIQTRLNELKTRVRESEEKVARRPGLKKVVQEVKNRLAHLQGQLDAATTDGQVLDVDRELTTIVVRMQELRERLEETVQKPREERKKPGQDRPGPPGRDKKPQPQTEKPGRVEPAVDTLEILRDGYRAYFDGDYDKAMDHARQAGQLNHPSCYVDLLAGCVNATRYMLNTAKDDRLIMEAKEAFSSARRKGCGEEALTQEAFSPKIIRIYKDSAN